MKYFGDQIKNERQLANMTIADLSKKSGIDEQTLSLIEEGTKFPDIRYLMKLATAFGKHMGYFLSKIVYQK